VKNGHASSILVIEDDPDMRGLLVLMLEDRGHHVVAASDGREGLDVLRHERPDLILLDMKMPVMDGWEFARRYREAEPDPSPIVVMTAAEDPRQRAEEVGAAGWLGKPVELDLLYDTIDQIARPH
jgi:CheY-like chemotaxis protein